MTKLIEIAFGVVVIAGLKTVFISGVTASPESLFEVLEKAMLVEYLLWIMLSASFINYLNSRQWFRSTYRHSRAKHIQVDEAGNEISVNASRVECTPDYDEAKKAFTYSKFAVIASLFGTVVAAVPN